MEENNSPLSHFKKSRLILPILFSLSVAGFMIYRDYDPTKIQNLSFNGSSLLFLLICFVLMAIRDAAYIVRMKWMAGKELSWRAAFEVTLLWEFSNTIAPSLTGGTPFMIYLLVKEKLNIGKSTAIIFLTIFFDQLFFTLLVPFVMLFIGKDKIFETLQGTSGAGMSITFWSTYAILAGYVVLLGVGLLFSPTGIKRLLIKLFHTRLLIRWKHFGVGLGNDLMNASSELKQQNASYWAKLLISTVVAWTSRFFVLNCLLTAFSPEPLLLSEHIMAFGRQSVLFLMMFIAPTPGGSGVAEFLFAYLLSDMCPNPPGAGAMAFLWRLVGFYPYLLLGTWLLPRWISRVFGGADATPKVK